MIPNKFVIFWDNKPIGLDRDSGGYPYKTNNPNQIKYWDSLFEAQHYRDMFPHHYMKVIEIQFRIMDKK